MNSLQSPGTDAVSQLDEARKLALGDSAYYPQIVPGVLPIIGPTATLDLRRWGSDFLAEAFACPTLPMDQKQQLSLKILQTLKEFLDIPGEDAAVVKSAVQTATSVYPLVYKHIIYNAGDDSTWQKMVAIKSNILKRMDAAPAGVKVCCIKFIQKVVLVQTPGLIADPRRPDQNELSLSLVPRDHSLIPPPKLEAEAFGLLDRLLSVFQDTPSDALLVTATLNSVGVLVRTRASIANRILNAILNFNPFRVATAGVTPRMKVVIKSMERTVRAFLINLNKRNPNHPLAGKVAGYLERLYQMRSEFFDEGGRKRPAEPTDGLDPNKRQRLGADLPATPPQASVAPPLPPGPVSVAQVFTLTQDDGAKAFDVKAIPIDLVNRIIVPILISIDRSQLDTAMNAVRSRYLSLSQPQPTSSLGAAQIATGNASNATNAFQQTEDAEQIINRLDAGPADGLSFNRPPEMSLGPFVIPQPPPLTNEEVDEYGKGTVTRVFGMVDALAEAATKTTKTGFNRLAASSHDKDAWVTVVARLATRSLAGLEPAADIVKKEGDHDHLANHPSNPISSSIRESLHIYVLSDFRRRIDAAISWLNEEWYNDQIQLRAGGEAAPNYDRLCLKLFDGIVPYLDAKDSKVLIRFLSEIPSISDDILERVKRLARDPERVSLAVTTMHYLALFRPPVREMCIDGLEDLWRNYDDAKAASAKMLQRWRPQVLQSEVKSPPLQSQAVDIKPAITA